MSTGPDPGFFFREARCGSGRFRQGKLGYNPHMGFPETFIHEVRNTASIVDLIGSYINLRKRGRNHVGLCPFHSEKTPSFHVSEERQWFHCFGCGARGDAFKFLMQSDGLTFPEAVKWLAERYGIPIPASVILNRDREVDRETLTAILRAAGEFFHQLLLSDVEAENARQYLQRRDIRPETVSRFGLGYAPGSNDRLCSHLSKKGFHPEQIEQAGLARKPEGGQTYYDVFRRRLMIPIRDLSGRPVAFGGRVLDDGVPKYINSPETPVYIKGNHLFGLDVARDAIRKAQFAVLVEGYLDCISAQQAGIGNIVASLGTSLTSNQARILARYTQKIIVNYDPDTAGVNAARRSLDLLLEEGFRVNVLLLPDGLDPDAAVGRLGGDGYRKMLSRSIPYLEFLTEDAVKSSGGLERGPGYQVQVLNRVLPFLAKVNNRVERLEYMGRLAHRLNLEESVVLAEFRKAAMNRQAVIDEKKVERLPDLLPAEKKLVRALIDDPDVSEALLPLIDWQWVESLRSASLFQSLREMYESQHRISFAELEERIRDPEDMALLSSIYFQEDSPSIQLKDAVNSLNAIKRLQLERRLKKIQFRIENQRSPAGEDEMAELWNQKMEICRQLKDL